MTHHRENRLSAGDLLRLKRFETPAVYNGWEAITKHKPARGNFNLEQTTDYAPELGIVVGYAVTVVVEPSNPKHKTVATAWSEYRKYVASVPGPKIVVVQDLDKPTYVGAFWGEVNSNTHRALGCIGSITDGAIRDVRDVAAAGFKILAAGTCVGHAYSTPVRWNCGVEVFGCKVSPGQLIHADGHGFLVIPDEDQPRLLEATEFLDRNECRYMIAAAKNAAGKSYTQALEEVDEANRGFREEYDRKFGGEGEW